MQQRSLPCVKQVSSVFLSKSPYISLDTYHSFLNRKDNLFIPIHNRGLKTGFELSQGKGENKIKSILIVQIKILCFYKVNDFSAHNTAI